MTRVAILLLLFSACDAQTIAAIAPDMTSAGTPDMILTVNAKQGDAFPSGSVVFFGDEPLKPFANQAKAYLRATVPAELLASPGTVEVHVQTKNGDTNSVPFLIAQGSLGSGSAGSGTYGGGTGSPVTGPNLIFTDTESNNTRTIGGADGTVTIGAAETGTAVTLSNIGSGSATTLSVGTPSTADFSRTTTCGSTLAASSTCTITPTCDPASAGNKSATITITAANHGDLVLNLSCNAVGEPEFSVSPSAWNFGTVAQTQTVVQTFTISNPGTADLTVDAPSITTGTHFFIVGGTCQSGCTVAAGDSATVIVQFAPQTSGALSDTLDFTSDASSTADVSLDGTGGASPSGDPIPSFSAGRSATKIRLVSLSEIAAGPWAAAADVDVIGEDGLSLSRTGVESEPSPSGHTVLYSDDFEDGTLNSIDDLGSNPTRFTNSTTRAHGGTHSLKVDYGVANNGQARIFLSQAVDEAYFQFWAYFDSGFVHDGHMFTVCGDSPSSTFQCDGKSGQRPSGNAYSGTFASPDGWFYVGYDPEFPQLHNGVTGWYPFMGYTYYPDMSCPADYNFNSNANCFGEWRPQSNPQLPSATGSWHKFILHVKVNDIGSSNGLQELWIDGVKANIPGGQDFKLRNDSSIQIDAFVLPFYCPSCAAQVAYLDDITIWQQASSQSTQWTTTADSEETVGESGLATNATDVTANGTPNLSTFWTTQWQGGSPGHPHTLTIDLGGSKDYTAFRYLPRQDGCDDGWIKDFRLEDTTDGSNWNVVRTGTFDYTGQTLGCFGASVPSYLLVSIGGGDPVNHTPGGTQTLGGTTPAYYSTLRNCDPSANADCSGVGDLTISSVSASGDFAISSDGCTGQTISPQQGCSIGTTFTPTASGQRTGVITAVTNGGTVTQALVGTGANPSPTQYTLNATKSGTGSGTVTSSPAGINCGSTCSANYNSGTVVTLTATPNASSTFTTWSGCSSSTSASINVTMDQAKNCNAQFTTTVSGGGSCVTFCKSLESGMPVAGQDGWGDVYTPQSYLWVTSPVHSGSHALQTYGGPGLTTGQFMRGDKLEPSAPRGTEFWVREWIWISTNWTASANGGHLFRVDNNGAPAGEGAWSLNIDLENNTHELKVREETTGTLNAGTGFFFPSHRGEWHCFELHGIVSTGGNANGTVQFYIDGSASPTVSSTTVKYGLDASPSGMFRIQFLSNMATNNGDQWSANSWLVLDDPGYNSGGAASTRIGCN